MGQIIHTPIIPYFFPGFHRNFTKIDLFVVLLKTECAFVWFLLTMKQSTSDFDKENVDFTKNVEMWPERMGKSLLRMQHSGGSEKGKIRETIIDNPYYNHYNNDYNKEVLHDEFCGYPKRK